MKFFDFLFSFCVLLTYVARVSADNPLQLAKRRLGSAVTAKHISLSKTLVLSKIFDKIDGKIDGHDMKIDRARVDNPLQLAKRRLHRLPKHYLSSKTLILATIIDHIDGDDMWDNMDLCKTTKPETCDDLGPFAKYLLMVDPTVDTESFNGIVWQQFSEIKKLGIYIESLLENPLPLDKFVDCDAKITAEDIFARNALAIPEDAMLGTFAGPIAEIAAVHAVLERWGEENPNELVQEHETLFAVVVRSILDAAAKAQNGDDFERAVEDDLKEQQLSICHASESLMDDLLALIQFICEGNDAEPLQTPFCDRAPSEDMKDLNNCNQTPF